MEYSITWPHVATVRMVRFSSTSWGISLPSICYITFRWMEGREAWAVEDQAGSSGHRWYLMGKSKAEARWTSLGRPA